MVTVLSVCDLIPLHFLNLFRLGYFSRIFCKILSLNIGLDVLTVVVMKSSMFYGLSFCNMLASLFNAATSMYDQAMIN